MTDQIGRKIDYLRLSITDRCNLRCVYCMPPEGIRTLPREQILRFDEIEEVCLVLAGMGIRHIRVTGGEPLVRRGCAGLIGKLKALPGIETATLTTNGILLAAQAEKLLAAGVDGINVSLDTMDRERYREITGSDGLGQVLEGLDAVAGKATVKVNAVLSPGRQEDAVALALLAKERPIHVRFIEMMPIGRGKGLPPLDEERLRTKLEERFGALTPCPDRLGPGPARYYRVEGFRGRIGFISALSHRFCPACNRVRLTAEGYFKTCLEYEAGCDLRAVLRSGKEPEEIRRLLRDATEREIARKPEGHHFAQDKKETGFFPGEEGRGMSQIGG